MKNHIYARAKGSLLLMCTRKTRNITLVLMRTKNQGLSLWLQPRGLYSVHRPQTPGGVAMECEEVVSSGQKREQGLVVVVTMRCEALFPWTLLYPRASLPPFSSLYCPSLQTYDPWSKSAYN